jgi:hypothetical protein
MQRLSEGRATEEAALGLALDYIDRGFSEVEVRNAETDVPFGADFLLAEHRVALALDCLAQNNAARDGLSCLGSRRP